jgi:hypothetical protein
VLTAAVAPYGVADSSGTARHVRVLGRDTWRARIPVVLGVRACLGKALSLGRRAGGLGR